MGRDSAAQKLAEYMQKVGPDKWVTIESVQYDLGIEIDSGWLIASARTVLTVGDGLYIERRNSELRLTRSTDDSAETVVRSAHDGIAKHVARARCRLDEIAPHVKDSEERARLLDREQHLRKLEAANNRARHQAERKKLLERERRESIRQNSPSRHVHELDEED